MIQTGGLGCQETAGIKVLLNALDNIIFANYNFFLLLSITMPTQREFRIDGCLHHCVPDK